MSGIHNPVTAGEFAAAAQHAAEKHLEDVYEYFRLAEEADEETLEQIGEDPAYGPFCSCMTCEVHEVLHAALPVIARGIITGAIDPHDLLEEPIEERAETAAA